MPRILVVDDSEVDRRLLAGLLEDDLRKLFLGEAQFLAGADALGFEESLLDAKDQVLLAQA